MNGKHGQRVPSRLSRRHWTAVVGLSGAASALLVLGLLSIPIASAATAPNLGAAASYSVLGGQSVTNTGATTMPGDLGVSPGNGTPITSVTGFPPGMVGPPGMKHVVDAAAAQAQSDLTTAYTTTAGLPATATVGPDISNQTFTAGVYNASSALQYSGTVTLNAEDDPTAVFIFQVGSGLTVEGSSSVRLENDAQACNVFWQVGSSASLGATATTTSFTGTIMALSSITMTDGVSVEGQALARNGDVTLGGDTFTQPGCDLTPPTTTTTAGPATTTTTSPPASTTTTSPPASTTTTSPPASTTTTSPPSTTPITTAGGGGSGGSGSGGTGSSGGSGSGGTGGTSPGTNITPGAAGSGTPTQAGTGLGATSSGSLAFTGTNPWLKPTVYLGGWLACMGALLLILIRPQPSSKVRNPG
jgi:Ice-binding-like